jgi:hypothetical protein
MENFSLAQKVQIGLLGLVAILLIVQISGVFSSSDSAVRQAAANDIQTVGSNPAAAANGSQAAITPTQQPVQPQTPPVPSGPKTVMSFGKDVWDFGSVSEGEKVEHVYSFKNTGNDPLIISNATGSCGCTVPQWPREPIAPGKSGEIKVVFDSKGKQGKRNQQVTITANTEPATTTIRMTGEVLTVGGAAATTTQPTTPIQVNPGGK